MKLPAFQHLLQLCNIHVYMYVCYIFSWNLYAIA